MGLYKGFALCYLQWFETGFKPLYCIHTRGCTPLTILVKKQTPTGIGTNTVYRLMGMLGTLTLLLVGSC